MAVATDAAITRTSSILKVFWIYLKLCDYCGDTHELFLFFVGFTSTRAKIEQKV
jgi:hypothetical protein